MKGKSILFLIFFILFLFSFGFAQNFSFGGAGVFGGVVFPEEWDAGFNAGGGVSLGPVGNGLYFFPNLVYWEASVEEEGASDVSTLSNFVVNVDVHYFFQGKQEGAFVGGGISYNSMTWEYSYLAFVPQQVRYWAEASDEKIGFQVALGYLAPLGGFDGLIKAKYNLIEDFNTFQISAGIMFGTN